MKKLLQIVEDLGLGEVVQTGSLKGRSLKEVHEKIRSMNTVSQENKNLKEQ